MVACRPNWVSLRAASVASGAPSRLTGNERVCCAIRQRTRGPQRKVTRAKCTGNNNDNNNEKALRETQTLRAGCSKAERKVFVPPQTPFPGARDGQNLMVTTFTYRPSLVKIDARNFEL